MSPAVFSTREPPQDRHSSARHPVPLVRPLAGDGVVARLSTLPGARPTPVDEPLILVSDSAITSPRVCGVGWPSSSLSARRAGRLPDGRSPRFDGLDHAARSTGTSTEVRGHSARRASAARRRLPLGNDHVQLVVKVKVAGSYESPDGPSRGRFP